MSHNGTNKKLRIYLSVLYVLFLIQWFWLVRHEYLLVVCELNIEKSSNIMDIWAQLTPISKLLTITVVYITIHVIVVGIIKFVSSIRKKD